MVREAVRVKPVGVGFLLTVARIESAFQRHELLTAKVSSLSTPALAGLKPFQGGIHVGRQRRFKPQRFTVWQPESERGSVKGLPGNKTILGRSTAIQIIAEQWGARFGQVHTNLVGASGTQHALHSAGSVLVLFGDLIRRYGEAPTAIPDKPPSVIRVTLMPGFNDALRSEPGAAQLNRQGYVFALDGMSRELSRQMLMRLVSPRDHQEAGRVFVDAMHNAGALHPADACQIGTVKEQRVDECTVRMARSRVNDQASRLVDNNDPRVLVHDRQRDILRDDIERNSRRNGYFPLFALSNLSRYPSFRCAISKHEALLD